MNKKLDCFQSDLIHVVEDIRILIATCKKRKITETTASNESNDIILVDEDNLGNGESITEKLSRKIKLAVRMFQSEMSAINSLLDESLVSECSTVSFPVNSLVFRLLIILLAKRSIYLFIYLFIYCYYYCIILFLFYYSVLQSSMTGF